MSPPIRVPVTSTDRAACGVVPDVLQRVGERWSVLILALLSRRPYGFNELDRAVDGLSRRILTRTLRLLEADGLVSRTEEPGPAGRVEYALTELGRSLIPLVMALGEWAVAHGEEIRAARARAAE